MTDKLDIDPASLAQLKREVEKIPPQTGERAEKARMDLKHAVERLEQQKK